MDLMLRHTVVNIIKAVSAVSGISVDLICGSQRHRPVVLCRSAVAMIARGMGHSYPQIGVRMGGRDHTTILSATKQGEIRIKRGCPDGRRIQELVKGALEILAGVEPSKSVPRELYDVVFRAQQAKATGVQPLPLPELKALPREAADREETTEAYNRAARIRSVSKHGYIGRDGALILVVS